MSIFLVWICSWKGVGRDMRDLSVFIEVNGVSKCVGALSGNDSNDVRFSYTDEYLSDSGACPISISFPLKEKTFSAQRTRNFFEGLLPEGFTRRCVAERLHIDEHDYVSILAGLGRECLGAVKIIDDIETEIVSCYRELSSAEVYALAAEGAAESAELVTKSHLSLTGASSKAGLYYDEVNGKWYLPIGEAPSTHIVKQSHVRLKRIVTNEQLSLLTAKNLGIDVPESFIVPTDGDDEAVLFATKRYDRVFSGKDRFLNGMTVPYRLHQEDFGQALGIAPSDKYEKHNEGYLKMLFEVIRQYSSDPMTDSIRLWDICVFNYLIGNTDNHIILTSCKINSRHTQTAYYSSSNSSSSQSGYC